MAQQRVERSILGVSPIGFGGFKIGRNQKIKYPEPYDLPGQKEVDRLLNGVLDLGINYIDTAPAYGSSEERIGLALSSRRQEFVLSTKVGEIFENGMSRYDFSEKAVSHSVHRSLKRLKTEAIDIVFIHSHGNDLDILEHTGAVAALEALKQEGLIREIGLSAKTPEGARSALAWAGAILVEYHLQDRTFEPVIAEAAKSRVAVLVKKGLASGRLPAEPAICFVLGNPGVTSLVVGGLNLEHMRTNVAIARMARKWKEEFLP